MVQNWEKSMTKLYIVTLLISLTFRREGKSRPDPLRGLKEKARQGQSKQLKIGYFNRKWQPILIFLPGKSHGQRSHAGTVHGAQRVGHNLATEQQLCMKLNKWDDNIRPWQTPFSILNQSILPCLVLTVASWPAHRFLRRQVKWSGIPISWRIFHSLLWSAKAIA